MKFITYKVIFETGKEETVRAFNESEASILAMALQIQAGNHYSIKDVSEVKS